jgi:hypothetical protein
MRAFTFVLFLASGCSLYFPQSSPGDDSPPPDARVDHDAGQPWPNPPPYPPPPPPPPIDAGPLSGEVARCEDGSIYVAPALTSTLDAPGHGAGQKIGICAGACQSAAVACTSSDCHESAATLCGAAPSLGATCVLDGTGCTAGSAIECPETTRCDEAVLGSSCVCANGRYTCKQETPVSATQAAIVGKWRGMVTPPEFATPYPISLWIYPDGTYWAESPNNSAFYYGGDGPAPDRRIKIQSTSATLGSSADIAIDFGLSPTGNVDPNHGAITALVVNQTNLRFTFFASWFGCSQPFDINLTRDR